MSSGREISPAERRHRGAMAATLAAAFVSDPAMSWLLPDAKDRARRLALFFPAIVAGAQANGLALRSPSDEAVTLWRTPGRIHPGLFETLAGLPAFMRALGGVGQKRAQALGQALRAREPRFPYWYLQFAGVAPAAQGKGWGGAAIRAGLKRARSVGMPVYLETSKRDNFMLYQHLGFELIEEWDAPADGPHIWSMLFR